MCENFRPKYTHFWLQNVMLTLNFHCPVFVLCRASKDDQEETERKGLQEDKETQEGKETQDLRDQEDCQ